MDCLISIIVPVYNVEKYIKRCVDSIINQTYKNIQIILVDDGSPDNCGKICDEYAKKDSRIVVIHKENGGLSDARNCGVEKATGEYIAFIDSDDYVAPNYIEYLYNLTKENNADISCCYFEKTTEDTIVYAKTEDFPEVQVYSGYHACEKILNGGHVNLVIACAKLIKSEIVKKYPFPKGRKHEDEAITAKYFYNVKTVAVGNKKLYAYYQNPNGIMQTKGFDKNEDAIWAFHHRACYFEELGEEHLAKIAYVKLFTYLLSDSALNNGRCDEDIKRLLKGKKLTFRTSIHKLIYSISPRLYWLIKKIRKRMSCVKWYWKIIRMFGVRRKGEVLIILLATPTHGNLGDQAIVRAELNVLKNKYPQKRILEIPNNYYLNFPNFIKKFIVQEDIIIIDGGGNLGTLWKNEDDKITRIIKSFSKNKIVIFPQTCYYDSSIEANERIEKNRCVYEQTADLTVMLRDRLSYELFNRLFPKTKAIFTPDIVLSLKPEIKVGERSGVLLCFREDCEKNIDDKTADTIIQMLNGYSYKKTSTLVPYGVGATNRDKELQKKWEEFAKAEFIICDRLHAMIFAIITETPCIALDNKSLKVSGTYEWVKDIPYVYFAKDVSEIPHLISVIKPEKNDFAYPYDKLWG